MSQTIAILKPSLGELRQDAFWYDGLLAETDTHQLWASGEVKVTTPGDETLCNNHAREFALDLDWTDADIDSDFEWVNNNWFEVYPVGNGGNEGQVFHGYDEAMKALEGAK
jgi:hypothetical protein